MPYAGLDISDDGLRLIEFQRNGKGLVVSKHDKKEFPRGLVAGGDVIDEKKFGDILADFAEKNRILYARISLPEEKAYLFQTDIPSSDIQAITQNVEFKLEENVPLAAADAVFYFDILPASVTGGALRASVSVIPRAYVEKMSSFLRSAGIIPVAFEVVPKSIAQSVISSKIDETVLVVHAMKSKTGIYIVSGGVVCFSSTTSLDTRPDSSAKSSDESAADSLGKEISRVIEYWTSRPNIHSRVVKAVLVGHDAKDLEKTLLSAIKNSDLTVSTANIWANAFNLNEYKPPISRDDSLEYAVAAGLALPA
jgi:Tfp pilus assembly PilM family ATPase